MFVWAISTPTACHYQKIFGAAPPGIVPIKRRRTQASFGPLFVREGRMKAERLIAIDKTLFISRPANMPLQLHARSSPPYDCGRPSARQQKIS
jgi:hypothetical protein